MPISSASVPIGATYSPSGGTATSFVSLGQNEGRNKVFLDDAATLLLRKTMVATSKQPVANAGAPNGFTQQRSTVVFHVPITLANGNTTVNSAKIEVAYDPETSDADRDLLWEMLGHISIDADFQELREDGSTA